MLSTITIARSLSTRSMAKELRLSPKYQLRYSWLTSTRREFGSPAHRRLTRIRASTTPWTISVTLSSIDASCVSGELLLFANQLHRNCHPLWSKHFDQDVGLLCVRHGRTCQSRPPPIHQQNLLPSFPPATTTGTSLSHGCYTSRATVDSLAQLLTSLFSRRTDPHYSSLSFQRFVQLLRQAAFARQQHRQLVSP